MLANGAWAAQVTGIPPVPVRPVKGQILRLDPGRLPTPRLTVRAFTPGAEIYLVPRDSGREVVVGATVEELGFDPTGHRRRRLRAAARRPRVLPMTAEYGARRDLGRLAPRHPRQRTRSSAAASPDGLMLATGHFRNGVLLTPVTADVIAALCTTGELRRRSPSRSR